MAREIIGFGAPGVAGFQQDDGFTQRELLVGDTPSNGGPVDFKVGQNTVLPLYSVVGRNAQGNVALAKADGSIVAEGVLVVPVATGAGQTTTARGHTSGHFNMNALTWDASFDTEAKKVAAFPLGSNILIGKNPYDLA
jgi:hypothetical protein